MNSPLSIVHDYRKLPCPRSQLLRIARLIYDSEAIDMENQTIVILCSDYRIRKLNRRFRDVDRATDVLSFNYYEPDLLGEIYISAHRARIQAKRYGVSYTEEVRRLYIHGMLHLLGYDHEMEADARRMRQKEEYYLNATK
jgi:probable rRNA maturation factor